MMKRAWNRGRDSGWWKKWRNREKERSDQRCFSRFLQLLIRSSGRLCDASGFIPSRSSLALVSFREIHCPPWAVYMPASQAACTTRPCRREREKKKFSSYSISPALSHAPESSFSVLPLIVYPSPQYSPFLALLSFSLNFHILKSFFFLIRRTFCPPRTSVQHTCRTLFAATQFAAQGRW